MKIQTNTSNAFENNQKNQIMIVINNNEKGFQMLLQVL